jgi:hypothetical protein
MFIARTSMYDTVVIGSLTQFCVTVPLAIPVIAPERFTFVNSEGCGSLNSGFTVSVVKPGHCFAVLERKLDVSAVELAETVKIILF